MKFFDKCVKEREWKMKFFNKYVNLNGIKEMKYFDKCVNFNSKNFIEIGGVELLTLSVSNP